MATTLSYGFIKPQDGDKGSTFWDDLETDIQKLNDHTHNGTNSVKLTKASIVATTATISSGSWSSVTGGFEQTVSMPSGFAYDDYGIQFRDSSGNQVYPTLEKVSSSSYKVTVNNSSLTLTVLYI